MVSPYQSLPPRSFWKSGVVDRHALTPGDLYRKKFDIAPADRIATAGSCFAQHIARHLRANGYTVIDEEPPPPELDEGSARRFGYSLYSGRYANIYTTRQLRQLILEALGKFQPALPVWQCNGRFYDSQRPSVEPDGLDSEEEVLAHRAQHLAAVRRILKTTDILVFTLGLTEAWVHSESGTVYPTAPGTIAGEFDPAVFEFRNFRFDEIIQDLRRIRNILLRYNPRVRLLLTVSPVPLTATASDQHVLVATTYSKSVLRAVAGQLESEFPDVAYFPSYEIIAGIPSRSFFYENNLRSVNEAGVDVVMRTFFAEHPARIATDPQRVRAEPGKRRGGKRKRAQEAEDVQCEEALLEAFAR